MTLLVEKLMTVSYLMYTSLVGDLYVKNFTDHPTSETVWTMVPAITLALMASPSLSVYYVMDEVMDSFTTLKAMGNQWYWSYECGDYTEMEVEFNSYVIPTSELKTSDCSLSEVGNSVTLPVNSNFKALTTSNDVTHCWPVPFLGVKVDPLPGSPNQTAFMESSLGLFMGACSEIFVNFHTKMGEKNFYITPWQFWDQNSSNETSLSYSKFHGYIMTFLVGMFITVSYLIHTSLVQDVYVSNFTDHPTLKTVWTMVPAIVLASMVFPSLSLLYVMDEVVNFLLP